MGSADEHRLLLSFDWVTAGISHLEHLENYQRIREKMNSMCLGLK